MPITTQQIISSLVEPGEWVGSTITFSIPGLGSTWAGYPAGDEQDNADYGVLNAAQAVAFRTAIAAWDRLIAPGFSETNDQQTPGQIRVAFTDVDDFAEGAVAYAYGAPTFGLGPTWAGDIWLDESTKPSAFTPTTDDFHTLIHELGHALGLKHPFEGETTLPAEYDNQRYTIMSYDDAGDAYLKTVSATAGGIEWRGALVMPSTPMLFDIVAIQSKYGADLTAGAGDSTYSWSQASAIFETVYDTGGIDTFDLSAHSRASIVDLTPGAFSSIAYWSGQAQAAYWIGIYGAGYASFLNQAFAEANTYTWSRNVATAYGTVIENVIAGSGSDTVTGNAAANAIYGRLGNDSIAGGDGEDFLRGDEGNDSITGGAAFDDIHGNMGDDVAWGGDGDDWVVGGKDNDRLFGEAGGDIVYGNLGADTLEGGEGADIVRGGQGNDTLAGGAGDDWMAGDRGDDTLSGGAGADIFHSHADAGIDRILDFNRAEGDRVNLLPGTTYSVAQSGADVVVSMGVAGQVVLVGVQLSSLTGDWLFGA
ncbi:M10 family metallopeptidase C-terminal domain-containing protein [Phenylobacterium sp.]|uniref:M10 family metallopeptidase C-terminal domain-containing protein n=1 Tax=Phenylobacterium sp. TaxID=1871053 RepID=UPI002FE09432